MDILWDGSRSGPGGPYLLLDEEETPTPKRRTRDPVVDKRGLPVCVTWGCSRRVRDFGMTHCALHEQNER